MKILQSGEAKSGNYWLYKIIQAIIDEAQLENRSFIKKDPVYPIAVNWELSITNQAEVNVMDITPNGCFYRISSIYRQPILNVEDYINSNTHVWTHSPFNETFEQVLPLFDKVVYIIRDPRDVALSLAKFTQTPYMKKYYPTGFQSKESYIDSNALGVAFDWACRVSDYLQASRSFDIHIVFYEQMLVNLPQELKRLLDYLGLSLSEDAQRRIIDQVSFTKMKAENPNHVNKAHLYGWKKSYSPRVNKQIVYMAGHFLKALNYPLSFKQESLPTITPKAYEATMKKQIALRRGLNAIKRAIRELF